MDSGSGYRLTKAGTGTLILGGLNTYTGGTTVSGGTLQLGNAAALGSSSGAAAISSGATLDLHGYSVGVGALSGAGTIDNLAASGTSTLTVGNGSGTFSGTIRNTTGTIALTKTGTGTLTLSGTNTYTGGTTVSGGLLAFAIPAAIPSGAGNITINSGGAVLVGGAYTTVTGWLDSNDINTVSTGALVLTAGTTSSEAITLGSYASLSLGASGAATYNGVLTPAGSTYRLGGGAGTLTFTPAITGATSLDLSGPGTVVLSGTNTYTGGTTVSGGTLDFSTPNATPSTGILTVNAGGYVVLGALLGASSPATDTTETVADANETSGTVVATSPASAGGAMATGGGASCGGTTSTAEALPATALPEPSTFALLSIGAIGLLGYAWRRRRRIGA